jgi:hypothetical protein
MNERTNTTGQPGSQHESTYALLTRLEEKKRNRFEVIIYSLLSIGSLSAIWQFAQQPVDTPLAGLKRGPSIVCDAGARSNAGSVAVHALRRGRHPEIKG